MVASEGDRKVHVFDVYDDRLELDPAFDLGFNRDIASGPARPHGVVFLTAQDDYASELRGRAVPRSASTDVPRSSAPR